MEKEAELVSWKWRLHQCDVLPADTRRRAGQEVEGGGGHRCQVQGLEVKSGGAGRQEAVLHPVRRPMARPLQEARLSGLHHGREGSLQEARMHI